jgi:hypothetical protein
MYPLRRYIPVNPKEKTINSLKTFDISSDFCSVAKYDPIAKQKMLEGIDFHAISSLKPNFIKSTGLNVEIRNVLSNTTSGRFVELKSKTKSGIQRLNQNSTAIVQSIPTGARRNNCSLNVSR